MKIKRAPNGYRMPSNFLSVRETHDLLSKTCPHGSQRSQKERQTNITQFVNQCFDYPSMAIFRFITEAMNEYMSIVSPCGRPAYTQKEAAWQSYLDLLNAAAWEEENREFIIEF